VTHRISISVLEPNGATLPQVQAWRDSTLLPQLSKLPRVEAVRSYAAFNAPQLVVVTQVPLDQVPPTAAQLPEARGSAVRTGAAELTYEIVQPGVVQPAEEALLYSVRFKVPDDWVDEFDRWYEQEHLAMIYECRHWSMSRRYRFVQPGPGGATHLALHYLNDARGLDAPQLKSARLTPWRNKFLGERWFTNVDKMIYFRQTL
jgi:hypothetical protein